MRRRLLNVLTVLSLLLCVAVVAGGCRTKMAPGRPDPAATAVMADYLDAAAAQDREKLQTLVLLPPDPERRKWVLHVISEAEPPPQDSNRMRPNVSMDGPVAVCRMNSPTADGPPDGPSSAAFLVRREGRWKVVIDYFQGGGLTPAEMAVIERHLSGSRETEAGDGE